MAETVQKALATRAFRVYTTDDVVGVEIGGRLKNVIAIAAGIVDGLGYGHNTVAALITRGLAEMSRLGVALGRSPGDLRRPRGSGRPRAHLHGWPLAQPAGWARRSGAGGTLDEARHSGWPWPRASAPTLAACALAERVGVEMPIAEQMRAVLYEGKSPRTALDDLMLRSLKRE